MDSSELDQTSFDFHSPGGVMLSSEPSERKLHVPHHRLLALADLLVVMVSLIHPIFKVPLEAKGLLEASGELGEEALLLDGVGHIVGVVAIGFIFILVLGSSFAKPWKVMVLDKRTLLLMDSDVGTTFLKKISMALLLPLEKNEPHDVRRILGKLAKKGTITHLMPNVVHDVQLLAAAPQLMCAHKEIHK